MRLRLGEVPGVVVPKALQCRLEKEVATARLKLGAQARKKIRFLFPGFKSAEFRLRFCIPPFCGLA